MGLKDSFVWMSENLYFLLKSDQDGIERRVNKSALMWIIVLKSDQDGIERRA